MPQITKGGFHPAIDPSTRRLDWNAIIAIGLLHVGCFLAPLTFSWSGLFVALFLVWATACLGITLCYHRLLTHRSFESPKWVEYFLTVLGCLNWQGGPARWVGTHRLHHRDSDQPCDPHSPRHGLIWSHMLWMLFQDSDDFRPLDAAKDLLRDPVIAWLDNYFYLPQFALAGLLYGVGYLIGGHAIALSWVVWGICLRTVFVYHGTWFVNSASHFCGYRNFETTDDSRNNWWVAALSFGEGWHNNHHAYQRSAAHGMKWWEVDLTYMTIRLMARLGMAKKIVLPENEVATSAFIQRRRVTTTGNIRKLETAQLPLVLRILRLLAVWT